MPETDAPSSILALMLRVAKLDPTGATTAGSGLMYTTDALVRFTWSQEAEGGLDLTQRKGNGDLCVHTKTPDIVKRYNCTLDVCSPDPELEQLISGGVLLTDSGSTIGYGAPKLGVDPVPDGVGLEVWSKAIDGDVEPAADPFFWWAFPKIKFEKKEQRVLEAGILANSYSGYMYENPNWGDGPANDWPANSDRAFQWVRTDVVPASVVGAQAIPTQT